MKLPLLYILLFTSGFLVLPAFSQGTMGTKSPDGIIRCLTVEREAAYQKAYPGMETDADFEQWIQAKIAERKRNPPSERAVITIPVIVHVIHNGEMVGSGSNISLAQINSQIRVLNEDFRRLAGTPGGNNHPDGADTEIDFCMAAVDPNGLVLSEPGIHRVDRNTEGFANPPYVENYIDNTIKPVTYWDPTRYMNFWVCDIDNDVLGFAKWPQSSTLSGINGPFPQPSMDGVVIRYKSFGDAGNVTAPYNKGRTATHEVGHFFGLRHIWGDGGCTADDYCADTPESDAGNFGCPFNHISCNTQDMTENYLDYTDDICMSIFTKDQKARMQTVLANSPRRMELANSTVCTIPMSPPTADFTADVVAGCPGLRVHFTDGSGNGATGWSWSFPGGNPGSSTLQNPVITYANQGTYNVSLTATNTFGNNTKTQNGFITINVSGLQVFYLEDFEGGMTDWSTDNPDSETTWELFTGFSGSQNGAWAAGIDLYLYETVGERDGLQSPVFDFSDKSSVNLEFHHAYRPYSGLPQDSLLIFVSTDGGSTFPHRVFAMGENGTNNFATNSILTSKFTPSSDVDWCYDGLIGSGCFGVDLKKFDGEPNVVIKFESYNDYGNNIYIDNIKLLGNCAVVSVDPEKELPTFSLYPNPNQGSFTLEFNKDIAREAVNILVFDILGRQVFEKNLPGVSRNFKENISLNNVPSGTYMVKVDAGPNTMYKKVVVE